MPNNMPTKPELSNYQPSNDSQLDKIYQLASKMGFDTKYNFGTTDKDHAAFITNIVNDWTFKQAYIIGFKEGLWNGLVTGKNLAELVILGGLTKALTDYASWQSTTIIPLHQLTPAITNWLGGPILAIGAGVYFVGNAQGKEKDKIVKELATAIVPYVKSHATLFNKPKEVLESVEYTRTKPMDLKYS